LLQQARLLEQQTFLGGREAVVKRQQLLFFLCGAAGGQVSQQIVRCDAKIIRNADQRGKIRLTMPQSVVAQRRGRQTQPRGQFLERDFLAVYQITQIFGKRHSKIL